MYDSQMALFKRKKEADREGCRECHEQQRVMVLSMWLTKLFTSWLKTMGVEKRQLLSQKKFEQRREKQRHRDSREKRRKLHGGDCAAGRERERERERCGGQKKTV